MKSNSFDENLTVFIENDETDALSSISKNKSDSYQYRIIEIAVDPFILSDFASEDGFGFVANRVGHPEELDTLRKKLMREVKRIIRTKLTKRQTEVMLLRLQGKTQVEIGRALGIHQTTVHKTISGVIDYKNGATCYGGAVRKLKKICLKDERILNILKQISDLYVDNE
jgi:DNA-binding NarL/FixJ family response regulator